MERPTYATAAEDDLLVHQALAGNLTAFDVLVTRHRSVIVRYTHTILHDAGLAEDATQDTFISAYNHLNLYRGPRAFKPWLRAIAYQQAVGYIRQRKRHREDSLEEAPEGQQPWAEVLAHPENTPAISLELLEQLPAMLQKIDHHKAEAIQLHILTGLSLMEVALRQGIHFATVSRRIQAGLQQLRHQFARAGVFAPADLPRRPPQSAGPLLQPLERRA